MCFGQRAGYQFFHFYFIYPILKEVRNPEVRDMKSEQKEAEIGRR